MKYGLLQFHILNSAFAVFQLYNGIGEQIYDMYKGEMNPANPVRKFKFEISTKTAIFKDTFFPKTCFLQTPI